MRGTWICVTGIDGVGKTSVCDHLTKTLDDAVFMKSPYFDWVREMIKISGDNTPFGDPYTDMLIFNAGNRLENYLIDKRLHEHKHLVTQRSWLDTFPYREVQGISSEEVIASLRPEKLLAPDVMVYLVCDPVVAYDRIKDEHGDKYETLKFMEQLAPAFDRMIRIVEEKASPFGSAASVLRVDANGTLDETRKGAETLINNYLNKNKDCD